MAAGVAALLTTAHARLLAPALGEVDRAGLVALVFAGTAIVYGIDRLRDVDRDRAKWPDRSAFASRHAGGLKVMVAVAGLLAAAGASTQPPPVWVLCFGIGAMGLAHRRLKTHGALKLAYLTLAWWTITLGLPWLRARAEVPFALALPVACSSACALAANMLVSNDPTEPKQPSAARRAAMAVAALGIAVAATAPGRAAAMACIPAAQLAAVALRRANERERLWLVDGSLGVGALVALALLR